VPAAVIPAPAVYTNVAAVKTLVVDGKTELLIPTFSFHRPLSSKGDWGLVGGVGQRVQHFPSSVPPPYGVWRKGRRGRESQKLSLDFSWE